MHIACILLTASTPPLHVHLALGLVTLLRTSLLRSLLLLVQLALITLLQT
jgi:hypothetical protein